MKDWVVPILVALIGGFAASAVVPLIAAVRGRGRDRADAVDVISDTAREWVVDFKAEALAARTEAQTARLEAHAARQAAQTEIDSFRTAMNAELNRVREEATALANELQRWRLAILAPEASIDGLRALVRGAPTVNGRP